MLAGKLIHNYHQSVKIIISSILPRDAATSLRRQKITSTNAAIKFKCNNLNNVYFLEHDCDWTFGDGGLDNDLYYTDNLHLNENGNTKLAHKINFTYSKDQE